MTRKNYELMELIRQKKSMSADIASRDREYSEYAGADLDTANQLVMVNLCLEEQLLDPSLNPILELYHKFLIKKKKAFFASAGSTEITKLGFIQGDPLKYENATDKVTQDKQS